MPGKIKIFLIEDDQDDREFLEVALQDNDVDYELDFISRGDQIIEWLQSCKDRPDIIIMDLNLPKLHGREVICRIKDKKEFKGIPFLVLTTSSSSEDKAYCLDRGADRFVSKPSDVEGFQELVRIIKELSGRTRRS